MSLQVYHVVKFIYDNMRVWPSFEQVVNSAAMVRYSGLQAEES